MSNMSDGNKDGLALFYIKDKKAYPIALDEEQLQMLDITLGMCLKEIKLINKPISGEISNLLER
ncbi:hypothetical protein [Clostridium botulinum]|uniref:hypothetical protein n=1 Tax=Clostridium botulinum TaxID=1491 RepID=UPI001C9AC88F|nr:hypothetical protein [Clostridium botulinum]MBY6842663.1 hypothetical protein [Clostridium botulinum]